MIGVFFKKLYAILLQVALLFPVSTGVVKIVHYAVDFREYKAQCENRDKEEISCNGLCKLGNELASETKETDAQSPAIPSIEHLLPLYYSSKDEQSSLAVLILMLQNPCNFAYKEPVSQSFINELIKPPTLV